MAKYYNLARMTTATTGTGTITLGSAVSGFLTFALAGVTDADVIAYAISDGANSEIGTGTYTASGTTLTRTVVKSTNSDAAINLSGTAEVFITALASDVLPGATTANQTTGTSTEVAVTPAVQHQHYSALKSWCRVTSTGSLSSPDYNVASVTDTGTGDCTVNIENDMESTTFKAFYGQDGILGNGNASVATPQVGVTNAGAVRVVSAFTGNGVSVTFSDQSKFFASAGTLA